MRDPDVRRVLKQELIARHGGEAGTIVVEELGLCRGSVRADIAVINGLMKGFEIKSDRDTLQRLLKQATVYSRVFDTATLVTAERHVYEAELALPPWWGIEVIGNDGTLSEIRQTRPNPRVDADSVAILLWRDEASSILSHAGATVHRHETRQSLCSRMAAFLPLDELRSAVREALKNRNDGRFRSQRLQDGVMFRPSSTLSNFPSRLAQRRSRQYTYRPN
jgi:hypothetical protein